MRTALTERSWSEFAEGPVWVFQANFGSRVGVGVERLKSCRKRKQKKEWTGVSSGRRRENKIKRNARLEGP